MCAARCGVQTAFGDTDDRVGQPRITLNAPSLHRDDWLDTSYLDVRDRFDRWRSPLRFQRCRGTVSGMSMSPASRSCTTAPVLMGRGGPSTLAG